MISNYLLQISHFTDKDNWMGLPWWSIGWDSELPMWGRKFDPWSGNQILLVATKIPQAATKTWNSQINKKQIRTLKLRPHRQGELNW